MANQIVLSMLRLFHGADRIALKLSADRVVELSDDDFAQAAADIPAFGERVAAAPGQPVAWGGAAWATKAMINSASDDDTQGLVVKPKPVVVEHPDVVKSVAAIGAGAYGLLGEEHRDLVHIVLPDSFFDDLARDAKQFGSKKYGVWSYWMTMMFAKESDIRRWWAEQKGKGPNDG